MNSTTDFSSPALINIKNASFYIDVIQGLANTPKYLDSKYFYDEKGDELFQQIMKSPEYYLTNCELEILSEQTAQITDVIYDSLKDFDLVELGVCDAIKSKFLLKRFIKNNIDFTYFPIDISTNVITNLSEALPYQLPGLAVSGLNGEYFEMLKKANELSQRNKVVLFLGSNIGNMSPQEAEKFCLTLKEHLLPGDLVLIGFDLKKDPQTILNAYNDKQGYTREFNLNLLSRINKELQADFNILQFQHFPIYDPQTGSCISYLISKIDQNVHIGPTEHQFHFAKHETIKMEVSQKYGIEQINLLAKSAGFKPVTNFFDSKKWFVDAIWKV